MNVDVPAPVYVHVTVLPDCKQFDGNAAAAEPASAAPHSANKPTVNAGNDQPAPRTLARTNPAQRAALEDMPHPAQKSAAVPGAS